MDYFKVGTFNTSKYGLSWHKKEANTTPIVDGDNVSDAMQKAGMNVSCITLPVTNKASSKDLIKVTGYVKEDGLHQRLLKEFMEITMRASFDDEEAD